MHKKLLFIFLILSLNYAFSTLKIATTFVLEDKENLSAYGFFEGNIAAQLPSKRLLPYHLNTPLFSDYAEKLRFIQLPEGAKINYNATAVLDFPIGTIIIKTFYYPFDFRAKEKGRRLMETRLLVHENEGWRALEYVWNDTQTDAYLEVAGEHKQVQWIDNQGNKQKIDYAMPNLNQCKGCHNRNETMTPIGPTVRQLNGDFSYENITENQLLHWQRKGILDGLPDLAQVPKAPAWNDPNSGSLDARARAWLDINCAHCHNEQGPAKTSGLYLDIHQTDMTKLGLNKTPVAAGKGSGGRKFGIVKGKPDESMLVYRIESLDPGEMMPEVGRKLKHKEGIALIRAWIKAGFDGGK
jgi:uncharacterized repeat protein (TIGR03806 family)